MVNGQNSLESLIMSAEGVRRNAADLSGKRTEQIVYITIALPYLWKVELFGFFLLTAVLYAIILMKRG